jgi:hypothetical protein
MYSRIQNENSKFNTRCLYCFMTIAFDIETAEELDRREAAHICPEKAFAQLFASKKMYQFQAQIRKLYFSIGGAEGAA